MIDWIILCIPYLSLYVITSSNLQRKSPYLLTLKDRLQVKAVLPGLSPNLSFSLPHSFSSTRHFALLFLLTYGSVNSCTLNVITESIRVHELITSCILLDSVSNLLSSSVKCHHAHLNMTLTRQPKCYSVKTGTLFIVTSVSKLLDWFFFSALGLFVHHVAFCTGLFFFSFSLQTLKTDGTNQCLTPHFNLGMSLVSAH